jgi:hypothetical protein
MEALHVLIVPRVVFPSCMGQQFAKNALLELIRFHRDQVSMLVIRALKTPFQGSEPQIAPNACATQVSVECLPKTNCYTRGGDVGCNQLRIEE